MSVFYLCSCVAPSLVKIGETRRTLPGRWDVSPGPGGAKKAGVWPGPRSDYAHGREFSHRNKAIPMPDRSSMVRVLSGEGRGPNMLLSAA